MHRKLAWFLSALGVCVVAIPVRAQWPQWGGPGRDFQSVSTGLADSWPAGGPPVIWSRTLGTGHSAITVDDGRLFTLYRSGNGRAKAGPWSTDEVVAALDAKTGATIWEHKYPARTGYEDFSFGPGPHSSPLVVGDRVFTVGTNQQLFAFDKRTGKVIWSHDFVKEFKSPELLLRPNVKTGYGCSPIAFGNTILCSVGGAGQSVMAFRQSDGAVVWKSGDFLTSAAAPILINVGGRTQAVFFAGGSVIGIDPGRGSILWAHPHDPGNDLNCGTPLFGPDNILFMSSAYQAGSRAIRLVPRGGSPGVIDTEELWFTNRVRFMFLSSIRIGDFVYGTTGDFGPAFLTALNLKTGESPWQVRGFARASLLAADGKVIVMNEDGDLALVRLSPTGAEILSRAKIFETQSWTAPTLAGTTLYARDREKIVALDLAAKEGPAPSAPVKTSASQVDRVEVVSVPTAMSGEQPTQFSGSWQLDKATSTVTTGAGLSGLHPNGAPQWLFVTQPENGAVLMESATNASQSRFYRPGKPTTTATAGGTITMTSALTSKTLSAEGELKTSGGTVTALKEVISRDGDALVIEITAGDKVSRLRYVKLTDTGACENWPNPCKKSS